MDHCIHQEFVATITNNHTANTVYSHHI